MKRFHLFVALLGVVLAVTAQAQQVRKSPHETISKFIDGNRVTIVYGRPYTKDPATGESRKIWGGVVPLDKIWRFGADEATLFITQKPLEIGETTIPAGAYTLYMLPASKGPAKLLINKAVGQWGVDPYEAASELARIDLTKATLAAPVDQFTISIENGSGAGGTLRFAWERTEYSVAFAVKD